MHTQDLQLTYTISRKDILVGVDIAPSNWLDPSELKEVKQSRQMGTGILDCIDGQPTKTFWSKVFESVRKTGSIRSVRYRCDGPDMKRVLAVVIAPEGNGVLRLRHHLLRTEPLPAALQFRAGTSPESTRCSLCNSVRHGGVWRTPEAAWRKGLLKAGSVNTVNYDVCTSCATFVA